MRLALVVCAVALTLYVAQATDHTEHLRQHAHHVGKLEYPEGAILQLSVVRPICRTHAPTYSEFEGHRDDLRYEFASVPDASEKSSTETLSPRRAGAPALRSDQRNQRQTDKVQILSWTLELHEVLIRACWLRTLMARGM